MNCRILLHPDGRFEAQVRYRDDHEEHMFDSEDEARSWCKLAENISNGNDIKKKDIPTFRLEKRVVEKWEAVPVQKGRNQ